MGGGTEEERLRRPPLFSAAAWQSAHVSLGERVWRECECDSVSFSCGPVFFSFSMGRDGLCALCGPDVYLWECRAAVARGVTHRSPAISAKPLIRHMTFSPGAALHSSAPAPRLQNLRSDIREESNASVPQGHAPPFAKKKSCHLLGRRENVLACAQT